MGLFNFLKTTNTLHVESKQLPPKRVTCDVSKIQMVTDLFQVPQNKRDDKWKQLFYLYAQTASFTSGDPQIVTGPDKFPYFVLQTPKDNRPFESFCILNIKDDFLLEKGLGITINPANTTAGWVFSYGDIVNLHINNEFISKTNNVDVQHIDMTKKVQVIKKGEHVMFAQPSSSYLPKQTGKVLKSFLQSTGIKRPMIMLLCRKNEGRMIQELAFNVHPEDFPSPEEHDYRMQQISWFLPRHYLIVSFSKNSGITKHFADL